MLGKLPANNSGIPNWTSTSARQIHRPVAKLKMPVITTKLAPCFIREDIYLRIMQVAEASGAKLAVPSVVNYNTVDTPPDKEGAQASEEQVEHWRREGKLPFPDFCWQDKADLRETLDYPPEGSALHAETRPSSDQTTA